MMGRFTTGLIAGGLIGVVGISWMMSDTKTRKRVLRDSKRAMRKAEDLFNDMTDRF